ncbi:MAG TPA: energy-coupling factor transporter transmembrane component T [Ktedonobacteraceae bacterium]
MLLKNVSLGAYYPGTSLLHRLQARTKLLVVLMCLGALLIDQFFFYGHIGPYLMALALILCGVAFSRISVLEIARRMWLLTLIVLFGALLSLLIPTHVIPVSDGQVLYILPPLLLTPVFLSSLALVLLGLMAVYLLLAHLPVAAWRQPGFRRKLRQTRLVIIWVLAILGTTALFAYFAQPPYPTPRLAYMITVDTLWTSSIFFLLFLVLYPSSLLLTMTTSPVALIEGVTMLMAPLRWLRLPVDDFALMTLIALRFMPTLFEEFEQLLKAQAARGASFSSGSPRERMRSGLALFIAFLRNTLRRASDLAIALDARGYQVNGQQTRLYEKRFTRVDYLVLLVVGVCLLLAFFLQRGLIPSI